jgi:hypothetical protein
MQNILQKFRQKKDKFREADENLKIGRMVVEREKSSNERELERFMEEEREKSISLKLAQFRKERQKESMRTTMFDGADQFRNQKNIFKGNKNMFAEGGGLFFK